jgi:hypothetical protein
MRPRAGRIFIEFARAGRSSYDVSEQADREASSSGEFVVYRV